MNLITGDSHSEQISIIDSIYVSCSGGSAKGLNNPNSILQYNNKIIENVKNNNFKNLFFLFGGVDVDFGFIYKYMDNVNIDYKVFNTDVIYNYLEFIKNNFHQYSVVILSIGLPVLDDEHLKHGILNGNINYLENQNIEILEQKLSNSHLPNIYKRTEIAFHFISMKL